MDAYLASHVPVESRHLIRIGLTAIVVVAIVALVARTETELHHDVPYKMVDELGLLSAWDGHEVRLHGFVVAGTVFAPSDDVNYVSFVLGYHGERVRVFAFDPPTTAVRDGDELVVRGQIVSLAKIWPLAKHATVPRSDWRPQVGDYSFLASEVSRKCSPRYDPPLANLETSF